MKIVRIVTVTERIVTTMFGSVPIAEENSQSVLIADITIVAGKAVFGYVMINAMNLGLRKNRR